MTPNLFGGGALGRPAPTAPWGGALPLPNQAPAASPWGAYNGQMRPPTPSYQANVPMMGAPGQAPPMMGPQSSYVPPPSMLPGQAGGASGGMPTMGMPGMPSLPAAPGAPGYNPASPYGNLFGGPATPPAAAAPGGAPGGSSLYPSWYTPTAPQANATPATSGVGSYMAGLNENMWQQQAQKLGINLSQADFNAAWAGAGNSQTGFFDALKAINPAYAALAGPGAQPGIPQSAMTPNTAVNPANAPQNAFSPQGTQSTLPNMFGQGQPGSNTNSFGGGGNIFGAPAAGGGPLTNVPNFLVGSQPNAPGQPGVSAAPPGASPGQTPDQAMAALTGNINYLQSIAQGQGPGSSIDTTPAWQAMIASQQRNIQENAANLAEQFNVSGDRFSTAFGTGMSDYYTQTSLGQNSQLAALQVPAMQQAMQNQLTASGQLATGGTNALSQLSSQEFQSLMQQAQLQYGAGMGMLTQGTGAATTLDQLAAQGTMGLNSQASQAAMQQYQAEIAAMMAQPQYQIQAQTMQGQQAAQLSALYNQNLQTGAGLGSQQYNQQQSALNNLYQQWLYQQPQNNPLIQMMYAGATANPLLTYPQQIPGQLGGLLGGLGGLAGGIGGLAGGLSSAGGLGGLIALLGI